MFACILLLFILLNITCIQSFQIIISKSSSIKNSIIKIQYSQLQMNSDKNEELKRKRKTKLRKNTSSTNTNTIENTSINTNTNINNFQSTNDFNTNEFKSKLQPIKGSREESILKANEKNVFERFIDDITTPTPKGQEPKAIQYIKSITWFAVIVLVLVEIFVSLKVGGAPFKFGESMELPQKPNWLPGSISDIKQIE